MSPFPALDPEPPPRPLWRAALIPGAVAVGVVVVVALAVTLPSALASKHHSPPRPHTWSSSVPGEIIGWNGRTHTVVALTPAAVPRNPSVLATDVTSLPATSASGFGLMTSPEHVSFVENGGLTPGPPPYQNGSPGRGAVYGSSPFAADDNALVTGGQTVTGAFQTPVLFNINTSNRHALPGRPADQVAGDPATNGAWVTVIAGPPNTPAYFDPEQADSRIEYRAPHRHPVTLATVAGLRHIAGFTGSYQVHLTAYPSPSGRQVAIDVLETGTTQPAPEAIVVVTSSGHLLGKLAVPGLQQVSWAGSNTRLLVMRAPGILTTWAPGSSPTRAIPLPVTAQGWGNCLLSPDGKYVVCAGFGQNHSVSRWALIRLADRAVLTEATPDVPVDWSP